MVVGEETTPTDTVTALPDGTFRLDAAAGPVRARQGDAWVPIDTTLQAQADSSLKPKAGAVGVVFSGGGSGPLVRVSAGDGSYDLSVPWSLPTPEVSGATATYRSVLPDVDLVVSAVPDGFTENLVVKTREAALSPEIASLRFPVSLHGLAVRGQDSGGAALVDGEGRPVLSTGAAVAWDSGTGTETEQQPSNKVQGRSSSSSEAFAGPADTAVAPGPGARVTTMDVDVTSSAMTVTPDQGFLTDPSTTYPVVLDPQTVSQSLAGWTALWSTEPSTSFWKTSHTLGVGWEYPVNNKKVQSLYQFDTHGVEGKKVLHATFTALEVWSANCTEKKVNLWHTGGISSSTTYNKPPKWMSVVDSVTTAKGWSSNCPGGNVEFDATSAVAYGAERNGATTTLGLKADESDPIAWKQFASPSDTKPVLSVTFVSAPSLPTSLRLASPNLICGVNKAAAVHIHTQTPAVSAVPKSADSSQATLRPNFEIRKYDPNTADPLVGSGSPSGYTASGTAGRFTSPSLANGGTYWFRARTEYKYTYDGKSASLYSAWTSGCWFTVDTSAPPAPAITSSSYPECAAVDDPDTCTANGGVGQAGFFTVKPGASDVVKYVYTLNGNTAVTRSVTSDSASLTFTAVPDQLGLNTLSVTTYDAAGNSSKSEDGQYWFRVAPGAPALDNWSFDEGTGTKAADSIGAADGTLGGTASWSTLGRLGGALALDGATGSASAKPAALDTSGSFTISAWARLSNLDQTAVITSQDGVNSSAFSLYYSPGYQRWVFNRNASDVAAPTVVRSISNTVPVTGVWTHLLGVYDKNAQSIQLYINGVPQGDGGAPTAFTTPWKASGDLQIGRGQYKNTFTNFFPGQIDEVQLWNRILSPQEVAGIQGMTDATTQVNQPAEVAHWKLDESDGTPADTSGYARDTTLGATAQWYDDTDGGMGNVLSLDGRSTSVVTAHGPLVDSQGSFSVSLWVKLDPDGVLADTSAAHTMRLAGQSGTVQDSWGLWYQQAAGSDVGAYVFGRTAADAAGSAVTTAPADVAASTLTAPGDWTMLTGVYDSATQSLELYVNATPVGVVGDDPGDEVTGGGTSFTSAWQATGDFSLGQRRTAPGSYGDFAQGMFAQVHVWTGVVPEQTLKFLYSTEGPDMWGDA